MKMSPKDFLNRYNTTRKVDFSYYDAFHSQPE